MSDVEEGLRIIMTETRKQVREAQFTHDVHSFNDRRNSKALSDIDNYTSSSDQHERLRAKFASLETEHNNLKTKYAVLHESASEKLLKVKTQNVVISKKLQYTRQENANLRQAIKALNPSYRSTEQVLEDSILS